MAETWVATLVEKDQQLFEWLTSPFEGSGHKLRFCLRVVSHLGDGHLWAVLALWLWLVHGCTGLHAFLAGAIACLGSLAFFKLIKNRVARPRPDSTLQSTSRLLVPLDQYSFPSGHSATSLSVALSLGHFFPSLFPYLLALSLMISASRVALKVHYPLDILAGWFLGASLAGVSLLITAY